jgi:hemerythrin-like domain-containing protein
MAEVFRSQDKNKAPASTGFNPYKPVPAAGAGTGFDARLVPQLTDDHKQLLHQLQTIRETVDEGHHEIVRELLSDFRITLQAHLLTENVKLYIYLGRHLTKDGTNARRVERCREEMAGIGRKVMDFLRRYTDAVLLPERAPDFLEELDGVVATLARRIEREESELFPLYLPSY